VNLFLDICPDPYGLRDTSLPSRIDLLHRSKCCGALLPDLILDLGALRRYLGQILSGLVEDAADTEPACRDTGSTTSDTAQYATSESSRDRGTGDQSGISKPGKVIGKCGNAAG